jgi:hypothetical protein
MEGIEKPHTDKYKEITNEWNYDASCMLTSRPVWDSENFKHLIFVVQSVQYYKWTGNTKWLLNVAVEQLALLLHAYEIPG